MPVTRSTSGKKPLPDSLESPEMPVTVEAVIDVSATTEVGATTEDTSVSRTATTTSEVTATEATATTDPYRRLASVAAPRHTAKTHADAPAARTHRALPSSKRSSRASVKARRLAEAREEVARLRYEHAMARLATIEATESSSDEEGDTVIEEGNESRVQAWMDESRRHTLTIKEEPFIAVRTPQAAAATTVHAIQIPVTPAAHASAEAQTKPAVRCVPAATLEALKPNKHVANPMRQEMDIAKLADAITLAVRVGQSTSSSRHAVELPIFEGAHEEWLAFRAAYYESAPLHATTENMARLRKALKGRAREAVESLLLNYTSPTEIIKALESRFGRPNSIALAELTKLRAIPKPSDTPRDLCIFASRVNNTVATLRALDRVYYLYNPELTKTTIEKLAPTTRYRWYEYAAEQPKHEADLLKLARFLNREAELCSPYAEPEPFNAPEMHKPRRTQRAYNTSARDEQKLKCLTCKSDDHTVPDCSKFKDADIDDRWDMAKSKSLCFKCLKHRTRVHRCKQKPCDVNGCDRTHHSLLHYTPRQKEEPPTEDEPKMETVASTWLPHRPQSFLKIVKIRVSGPAGAVDTHALLDDGSTVTLVDATLAEEIGARGPIEPLRIEAIADTKIAASKSRRVRLDLTGDGTTQRIHARTIRQLRLSPQTVTDEDVADCQHLIDIEDQLRYKRAHPRVIIGQDNWHLLLAAEVREGKRGQPVASRTPLGWTLHGVSARAHAKARTERLHYVNFVTMEEEATKTARDVYNIHSAAGFETRRWKSNSQKVLCELDKEARQTPVNLDDSPENIERVLGLTLKPSSDEWSSDLDLARVPPAVIAENTKKPETKTFWTDSCTVLTWLRTGSRSYRPFVAQRIAAIEEDTTVNEWCWVPMKLNVADDATRDVPVGFGNKHRWYTSPDYLQRGEEHWPREEDTKTTTSPTGEENVDTRVASVTHRLTDALPDVSRFSSWLRLIRTSGRVLQFIQLCQPHNNTARKGQRNSPDRRLRPLPVQCAREAKLLWLRAVQQDSFEKEIEGITGGREPSQHNRLRQLALKVDDRGVLHLRSRINAALDIKCDVKEPAIMDGDQSFCRPYIDWVHRRAHHSGVEFVTNEVRQRFHLLRLRPTVRTVLKRCQPCRLRRATAPSPPTGNLPGAWIAHHKRSLTYTGVDYFGSVSVTVGRQHHKKYVALFTCLGARTRAVHLEVAASLSTDSAILALRRMMARRGCPEERWSDNGTNLRGANAELRRASLEAMEREANVRSINWRFIPPSTPFMGGAWEHIVRSVKTALRTILEERHPTVEVLATLLAEVEHTINSRPLTQAATAAEDDTALTPTHFLLGGPSRVPTPGTFTERDTVGRDTWRTSQRLADAFRARWVREALPLLQHRREIHGYGEAVKSDDIVIIADGNLPRNVWPRGIVTKTYPGPEGVVRTADFQTRAGVLRRPVKKLVVLLVDPEPLTEK